MWPYFYTENVNLIMLKIIINYSIRNLIRSRLRTSFTLLSVMLIMLLYTVLTSIGSSFSNQLSAAMTDQKIDIVIQSKHAAYPTMSIIDSSVSQGVASIEGVQEVHSLLIANKRLKDKKSIVILGVSDFEVFSQRLGFTLVKGRSLKKGRKEIMIGERAAAAYGFDIDDEIELDSGEQYSIVGFYSSWLGFLNSGIISDLLSVQGLVSKPGKASMLFVRLGDSTMTNDVIEDISQMYPKMRAVSSENLPNDIGPIKSIFYFSKIVSMMTLLIASAVLITTIIMTIHERTKEIGILGAIGWPRSMIIIVFIIESTILSTAGGVIGYVSSYGVFPILHKSFTSVITFIPTAPPPSVFIHVLLMSLVIGSFSSLFPAFYGTKIKIVKAIRHE